MCLWVLFAGLAGCGCLVGGLRALILGWLLLGIAGSDACVLLTLDWVSVTWRATD